VSPGSPQARVLGLQTTAGNAAVTGLLQRQPAKQAGWSDADPVPDPAVGFSWNTGRLFVGSVGRYPLEGIPEGNQGEWKTKGSASAKLTSEGAKGKAIGLVHKLIKPEKPVTVFVLLHGYAEDIRYRPYAGWRQHLKTRKVRDVEHDRIAQQLEAAGDPQIVVVLPQGGEQSQFGKDPANPYNTFASDDYVKEVLAKLVGVGALAQKPADVKVAISAHSGGGHTVGSMLTAENVKRAGGRPKGLSSAPSALGGVVLFDAMTWSELKTVKAWVLGELDELRGVLADPGKKPAEKQKALDDAPRFRGYYTLGESYVEKYENLEKAIRDWFVANGAALGTYADQVWALFQVVPWGGKPGEGHETIVRGSALGNTSAPVAGNLTDALKALKGPTALKPRPVPPPPKPKPPPARRRTRARVP
jgi:hypothetical protein